MRVRVYVAEHNAPLFRGARTGRTKALESLSASLVTVPSTTDRATFATASTGQTKEKNKGGMPRSRARIRTRALANYLVDKPSNPLMVMYRNLRHWDKEAQRLQAALEALDPTLLADDPQAQRDAFKTLAAHLHAREMSQRCAVDLAPYLHPRLAAIQWSPPTDEKPKDITGDMSPAQAAEAYANSLKQLEPPK